MRRPLAPLVARSTELRLVLSNCANHGDLPLQELLAEFIREPLESSCHIKLNPHPLVLLCVHLHLLSIAG